MVHSTNRCEKKFAHLVTVAILGLMFATVARETSAQPVACVGDCNNSGTVTVDDIITMVNVALEITPVSACPAGDPDHTGMITIANIIAAQNNALNGCPDTPTDTPTSASTPTSTSTTPTSTSTTPTSTSTVTPAIVLTATPTPTTNLNPTPTATNFQGPVPGAGLSSSITGITIGSDGQIVVTFTLTDANGIPITPVLASTTDPNQARTRFAIAHIENYSGGGDLNSPFSKYVNDVNATRPAYDSGGTLGTIDAAEGVYNYTFKTKLPQGFNPALTYNVGIQVDRTYQDQQLSANPVHATVPAGGTPEALLDVTTQQCNKCHQPLIAHGNRREVALCVLCHTEAAVDANGTTIDFRNMIHMIHAGVELPSIVAGPPGSAYQICGSRGCDVFAQKDANGMISGVAFPRHLEECLTCHAEGPTASYYKDRPAAAACATCHDDVNPSQATTAAGPPGTKHFQDRGFPDGDCTFCHIPDSGKEFDISVVGAHVVPERSNQLQGLNVAITGVTNHAAGQTPTFSFKVTNTAGTAFTSLAGLDRLAFGMSGPTTDYTVMIAPTAVGGGASGTLVGPDADGVFQYTPTASSGIPANATGTWSVGAEARQPVVLATVDPIPPKTVEEAAPNPVVTFTVDDSTAMMRRVVVDDMNCATCHGVFSKDFSIHGNLRNRTEYCAICHNANQSDYARRKLDPAAVAAASPVTSIDFKVMIHKIHRGEVLEQQPYDIYGFGVPPPAGKGYTILDFGEVRYPGDLRICQTCHVESTYLLPPYPSTALGTQVAHIDPANASLVVDGRIPPISSVCTACHDADDAFAHADTMTTSGGVEACPVCHEEGRPFAVSILHAGRR